MTDLPKKGDRVRVTETHLHNKWEPNDRVYELTRDAELFRSDSRYICFEYEEPTARHGSGAVKVEILERAAIESGAGVHVTRDALLDQATATLLSCRAALQADHDEFARGMRRAVEARK